MWTTTYLWHVIVTREALSLHTFIQSPDEAHVVGIRLWGREREREDQTNWNQRFESEEYRSEAFEPMFHRDGRQQHKPLYVPFKNRISAIALQRVHYYFYRFQIINSLNNYSKPTGVNKASKIQDSSFIFATVALDQQSRHIGHLVQVRNNTIIIQNIKENTIQEVVIWTRTRKVLVCTVLNDR